MNFFHKKNTIILLSVLCALMLGSAFSFIEGSKTIASVVYSKDARYKAVAVAPTINIAQEKLPKPLAKPPSVIKAVYVTGWSAGSKKYRNYLHQLFRTTQINAVVIDLKDYSGIVSYATSAQQVVRYHTYFPEIPDINELVNDLHEQGIYVIGRITVFEDPALANIRPDLAVYNKIETKDLLHPVLWQDKNGLHWLDPLSQEVADYNIAIAKDALNHGFDEINFDYVRFPSDGNTENMGFPLWNEKIPKHLVIKDFFKTLRESLPNAKISVDLFGQTTTNTDDMGIGQVIEDAFSYFDYVCPMVYPSHYVDGFMGYNNPAEHPYEIIKHSIETALARQQINTPTTNISRIRPWLQDFNLGAVYDASMVKQEMQAVVDATGKNFSGFLLWNPSNVYTQDAIALPSDETK